MLGWAHKLSVERSPLVPPTQISRMRAELWEEGVWNRYEHLIKIISDVTRVSTQSCLLLIFQLLWVTTAWSCRTTKTRDPLLRCCLSILLGGDSFLACVQTSLELRSLYMEFLGPYKAEKEGGNWGCNFLLLGVIFPVMTGTKECPRKIGSMASRWVVTYL